MEGFENANSTFQIPQKAREKQQQQQQQHGKKKAQEKPTRQNTQEMQVKYWFSIISTNMAFNTTPHISKHTPIIDKKGGSMGVVLKAFYFFLEQQIRTVLT